MPFEIKQVSPRKWNMINTETGVIHSHRSKAKAEAHMRLVNSMDSLTGKGLIEQKYIDSMKDPSPNFSPKVPLPTIGSFDITVPPYVIKPIQGSKKGKYKLVKTLTKTRNLSSRKGGISSIQLTPETHEIEATVESSGDMPTLDQFSKKDQAIIKNLFLTPNKTLRLENKQRGFPEVLPKNINRHRELGTSQLSKDFVAPQPRKRGRPKKTDLQTQSKSSTPRTPRTPRSPIPALRMPTNEEMGFDDNGNDLETPIPATPTPPTPTPTPILTPIVKKRGRPKKYETDEERKAIKKKQILASNKRLYIESLTPTHKEKYFQKQEKKAQKGKGILNDIKSTFVNLGNTVSEGTKDLSNKATDLYNKVSNHDTSYPPNLTALKNEVGEELITSLQIGRTPVPSAITSAMNAVSLGGFNKVFKSLPFDTLFHLFLIITTNKGKFLLEKNERINVSKNIPSKDLEVKDVVIPNNLSVNELIDTTQKYMGVNFLPYDPANQNCQDFISSLLRANNIATSELLSFVKQDTSEIFKQNPNLAKISRKLTDIGAAVNVIQQGGSLKIKSKHNNMDGRYMFSHNLPQAEAQIRASLGIMRGGNILGDIGNAFKSIPQKAAKALKLPTSVNDLKNLAAISQIPTDVGGVKRYGKTALTYGLPAFGSALGAAVGTELGGPVGGVAGATLGGIAGRVGAEQANKKIDGSGVRRRRGRPRKMGGGGMMGAVRHGGVVMPMSGQGWFDKVLDTSFTPRQVVKAAKKIPDLGREAISDIKGVGVLSKFLDSSFTPRQVVKAAKKIPDLGREAVEEIKGVGVRPAKGSPEMRAKMARLRSLRKK